jgi:hypothetical protein
MARTRRTCNRPTPLHKNPPISILLSVILDTYVKGDYDFFLRHLIQTPGHETIRETNSTPRTSNSYRSDAGFFLKESPNLITSWDYSRSITRYPGNFTKYSMKSSSSTQNDQTLLSGKSIPKAFVNSPLEK